MNFELHPSLEVISFGEDFTLALPVTEGPPVFITLTKQEKSVLDRWLKGDDVMDIYTTNGMEREMTFPEFQSGIKELVKRLAYFGMLAREDKDFLTPPPEVIPSVMEQFKRNPFFVKIPLCKPDNFLNWLSLKVTWIFKLDLLIMIFLGATATLVLFYDATSKLASEQSIYEEFLTITNSLYVMGILLLFKIPHELGHALTMKWIGRKVHDMGVIFLVFTPCVYCDVTEIQHEPSRWKRIAVSLAGVYVDILLSGLAAIVFLISPPGEVSNIARLTVYANLSYAMFINLMPLTRFDGHYALAFFWGRQNLAKDSKEYLQRWISFLLTYSDPWSHEDLRGDRYALAFFGLASFLYRIFLIFMITTFMYNLGDQIGLGIISGLFGFAIMIGASQSLLSAWDKHEAIPEKR